MSESFVRGPYSWMSCAWEHKTEVKQELQEYRGIVYHLTGCIKEKKKKLIGQNYFYHQGTAELVGGFSLKIQSFDHRIAEVGRNLWNSPGPTPLPCRDTSRNLPITVSKMLLCNSKVGRLHNLPGQPAPREMRQCKKHFLMLQGNVLFQFAPTGLILSQNTIKQSLALALFAPSLQIR